MGEQYKANQIDLTKLNLVSMEASFASQPEIANESAPAQQIVLDEFEMRRRAFFEIR